MKLPFSYIPYVKKAMFTIFTAVSLISFGAAGTAMASLDKYSSLDASIKASEQKTLSTPVSVQPSAEILYIVKSHLEQIGVYDTQNVLLFTVPVYIKTLPVKDRALLENGIGARSYEELIEILGDYTA